MNIITKYIWVVETIQRQGKMSFEALSDKYAQDAYINSDGDPLIRQTFFRWRESIREILHVNIECGRGSDQYYIANAEDLDPNGLSRWLLNTYSAVVSLEDSLTVKDRILTEPVPSSAMFLKEIIDAMKVNRVVRFSYTKFGSSETDTRTVRPYCVKLFKQRWYLLGYCEESHELRTFGLDRMADLVTTDVKFKMPADFDAEAYFAPYYGIDTRDDSKCERIVIRAWDRNHDYLRALPLHASQKEIASGDDYADFEVYLRPNYEFYWKLLSMGEYVQILSPESVRKEMIGWLKAIEKNYK